MHSIKLSGRFVLAIAICLSTLMSLQAASPRLSVILPRGIQRGVEHVVEFSGSRLVDAQEIFFYDSGFEVTGIEPDGNDKVKVTVRVAADCRLGEHVAQVRTSTGISDFRTFYVGALPAVAEKEPNSVFDSPQPIELNVTVTGVAENEDVDYYVVEAKKGERISVEVEAMRLGTVLFDSYVAILDSKRFELSAADDSPLVLQDSIATIVAPEDGKYVIEVRESAYGGNGNCRYRLHVGSFPRPIAVYPAGGKLGETISVRYLGDAAGEYEESVQLPDEQDPLFGLYAKDDGGIAPSPNPFRLFEHGNAFESEPNNSREEATLAELPLAFNGRIEQPGDVDFFKFAAKKGEVYEVECYARRIRSALDPVMWLYKTDGNLLADSDDSRGPDSYSRVTIPDDGEYTIKVTDHLGRGGSDFVYRIEFQSVRPKLSLSIPRNERYGQYRQTIFVPRGNRFATLINAGRSDFGGDLILNGDNLPAGITLLADPMPGNMNVMPVVFQADQDAPLGGNLVNFTARHVDPAQNIVGPFRNRADFIIGPPGQSRYRGREVDKLAIAVVDEVPFQLEIIEPKVPLVRNGSMQLKIVAHRKEGFTAAINVQLPFRPPGVGAANNVTIPEGQAEVLYPINADGGAPIKKWKVVALGSADAGVAAGGSSWVSSQLAVLDVTEPLVTFEVERASCEQGQQAQIYCKINTRVPFEGPAKVQLLGLPSKVTTGELEFTKDTAELVFDVQTDKTSPDGKHTNLFCQVTITQSGEPIVSRAGGTELQIDKPLPAPENPAPAEPKPEPEKVAEAEKPKAKPLTRLQKLRLAAKQRAEARAKRLAEANAN